MQIATIDPLRRPWQRLLHNRTRKGDRQCVVDGHKHLAGLDGRAQPAAEYPHERRTGEVQRQDMTRCLASRRATNPSRGRGRHSVVCIDQRHGCGCGATGANIIHRSRAPSR